MASEHFTELPTTSVEVEVAADAAAVWERVSDPSFPAAYSDELYRAEWVPPSTGPEVGARIHGWNRRGDNEWETFSTVTRCEPERCFEWTVDSLHPGEEPIATWSFEIEDVDAAGGSSADQPAVLLRQSVVLRPGRSGVTEAIDTHPEHRQRIIDGRLAQQAAAMQTNISIIKTAAEFDRRKHSTDGPPEVHPRALRQIETAKALAGSVVTRWDGVEMAVRFGEPNGYSDPQVPCLQMMLIDMERVDVEPGTPDRVRFVTYQNGDDSVLGVHLETDQFNGAGGDGFRYRVLDELPVGEIRRVDVAVSDRGDLAEIELDIDGQFLLLVAGETHELATGRITFTRYEDSVLVFTSRSDYDAIKWRIDDPPNRLDDDRNG